MVVLQSFVFLLDRSVRIQIDMPGSAVHDNFILEIGSIHQAFNAQHGRDAERFGHYGSVRVGVPFFCYNPEYFFMIQHGQIRWKDFFGHYDPLFFQL